MSEDNFKKFRNINYGFLLRIYDVNKEDLTFNDFTFLENKFPNCQIYETRSGTRLRTPNNYIFPCFNDFLYSSSCQFEEVYDYEYLHVVISSLYFYSFCNVNFNCICRFKDRDETTSNKINLLKEIMSGVFIDIIKDSGHILNYGILLKTLNKFNFHDKLSCSDFLFNLKI